MSIKEMVAKALVLLVVSCLLLAPNSWAVTCDPPLILCGDECVNPDTDANNCGTCYMICVSGFVCVNGMCEFGSSTTTCRFLDDEVYGSGKLI